MPVLVALVGHVGQLASPSGMASTVSTPSNACTLTVNSQPSSVTQLLAAHCCRHSLTTFGGGSASPSTPTHLLAMWRLCVSLQKYALPTFEVSTPKAALQPPASPPCTPGSHQTRRGGLASPFTHQFAHRKGNCCLNSMLNIQRPPKGLPVRWVCSKQQISLPSPVSAQLGHLRGGRCAASAGDTQSPREVYQGMFGPWSVEPADEFEVWSYRVGLTATVTAFVASAAISSTTGPSDTAAAAAAGAGAGAASLLNPLCVLGALGLGISLVQIHIYVDPLKKALQVLWLLGVLGAVYVASQQPGQPLPLAIAHQPWTVWFVGPAAAAVTGVAIKEGLCYGKPEAAALALLLPLLCLSHLGGDFVAPQIQAALLAGVCGAGGVFAARKYSQPVKDDIGDKSVFEFRKLPEERQEELLRAMKQKQDVQQ